MSQIKRKGTYALFLAFDHLADIRVGSLGILHFNRGTYCYIGSALGGLDQRLSRHLRKEKKIRWHIDNLTVLADSVEAWESYPDYVDECTLAHRAAECGMIGIYRGFGCSDCRCDTHLFFVEGDSADLLRMRCGLRFFLDL